MVDAMIDLLSFVMSAILVAAVVFALMIVGRFVGIVISSLWSGKSFSRAAALMFSVPTLLLPEITLFIWSTFFASSYRRLHRILVGLSSGLFIICQLGVYRSMAAASGSASASTGIALIHICWLVLVWLFAAMYRHAPYPGLKTDLTA